MIVIKMVGGLGNQMFQYALYRKFLELKKDVRYDSIQTKEHNGFELEKVFNVVKNPIQSLEEIKTLKLVGETTYPKFNESILTLDNVYLEGYWQCEKYFKDIESKIREEVTLKLPLEGDNNTIRKLITSVNSYE